VDGIEKQYKGQVKFIRVDMDAEAGKELAGKYYIFGHPTIVLYNEEGKEVNRLTGYHSAESLTKALDELLK